jgi:mannose-6-phosphate isomerase-like protein (cupin superfamily)
MKRMPMAFRLRLAPVVAQCFAACLVGDGVMSKTASLRRDEDRFGLPFAFLNGTFFRKVSGAETQGGIFIVDTIRSTPGGPPLHVHADIDEWFLVTEGDFIVQVGEDQFRLGPGDCVLGPRGTPHAFRNVSETGRMMLVFHPAGSMEAFFRIGSERGPLSPREFSDLSSLHGMTVVGPPLAP